MRAALGATLLALLTTAAALPGQGDPDRGRLFSLPRAQDDIYEWNKARSDIATEQYAAAVERLHGLLRRGRAGVVPIDESDERFMGLRSAVITTLRQLPEAGRAAYGKLVEREAGQLLRTAFASPNTEELVRLALEFPASDAARRANERLGDLALEAGRGALAQMYYLAARDSAADGSPQAEVLTVRMVAARAAVNGTTPSLSEVPEAYRDRVAAVVDALPAHEARSLVRGWPMVGGDGRPMRRAKGELRPQWQRQVKSPGFDSNPFSMHAIGGLSGVFATDGHNLFAFDALTGEELWRGEGGMHQANEPRDYEESINPDMVLAPACSEDIVVAALQIPTEGSRYFFRTIDVIRPIPARRLYAYQRSTGKLIWSHWDRKDSPLAKRFAGHDAAGPPLISDDTVYVASHDQTGAVAYYLSAYDLHTGEPKWRRLICSSQGAVNMFGNALMEFAASPLVLHDGVLFGVTNLGACFAADASDGRLRWLTAYEVIELPETRLTNQRMRDVYFANSPPAVTDGVLACTPIDSAYALGFDVHSGEPLWRMPFRNPTSGAGDMRWLLGAVDGEFVFSGTGVVGVKAHPEVSSRGRAVARLIKSSRALQLSDSYEHAAHTLPRGGLTENRIFFPSPAGLHIFDFDGNLDAQTTSIRGDTSLGNLLLVDGLMMSLRSESLEVHYDAAQLVRDAERLVERSPKNAAAILCLASLTRAAAGDNIEGASGDAAVRHYRRGLEVARGNGMSPTSPLYRRMATELFQLTLARAERLSKRNRERALASMRSARDSALDATQWIEAQKWVLKMLVSQPETYLEELRLLAREQGSQTHQFEGLGKLPVSVYVLWESAHLAEPAEAMENCQELIERYGDVQLGARPAREVANQRQLELIEQHGRSVYETIDRRAADLLARAAGDADLLRSVVSTFPHSRAADEAVRRMMDLAVETGDLGAAARAYGRAVAEADPSAGLLRRMIVAAERTGNPALANAFTRRALELHGDQKSDFERDGGKRFDEVLAVTPTPDAALPEPQIPLRVVAQLRARAFTAAFHVREVEVPTGFGRPADVPLYLSVNSEQLRGFDMSNNGEMFETALFSATNRYLLDREPLLLCGRTLLLVEGTQVRGIDYRTGEDQWSLSAGDDRMFTSLGVQDGVLHLFSEMAGQGDGGALLGVEPISGELLFRRTFPADRESVAPVASGGLLWWIDKSDDLAIEGLDATTGRTRHRIRIGESLMRSLDLDTRTRTSWLRRLPLKLFADSETLYLPVEPQSETSPARLVALNFDGETLWRPWVGTRDRLLEMAAVHGDLVAIVESTRNNRSGRVVLLDRRNGSLRKEKRLGSMARVLNYHRSSRCPPAPATLLISDQSKRSVTLNVFSLEGKLTSFSHALAGRYSRIASRPVIGEDFVAIPAVGERRARLSMFLVDRKNRRTLWPNDEIDRPTDLNRPDMFQCGPHLVLQSNEGITVLGKEGSELR